MRILISVYDKTGLVNFLSSIKDHIDEIYGTEGTVKYLKENNIAAKNSSNLTGFDDLLGGRVKTLHPAIFSGILSKRDSESNMQLEKYHYKDFDMVICNLYPFVEASKTDELFGILLFIVSTAFALYLAFNLDQISGIAAESSGISFIFVIYYIVFIVIFI